MLFYSSYKYVKMFGSLFVLIETCFTCTVISSFFLLENKTCIRKSTVEVSQLKYQSHKHPFSLYFT